MPRLYTHRAGGWEFETDGFGLIVNRRFVGSDDEETKEEDPVSLKPVPLDPTLLSWEDNLTHQPDDETPQQQGTKRKHGEISADQPHMNVEGPVGKKSVQRALPFSDSRPAAQPNMAEPMEVLAIGDGSSTSQKVPNHGQLEQIPISHPYPNVTRALIKSRFYIAANNITESAVDDNYRKIRS